MLLALQYLLFPSALMAADKIKLQEESAIRRFYKIILSWDYLQLLKQAKKEKNSKKEGTDDGSVSKLVNVKTKYKDVDDYIATYEPLIFEEAKSQIIKQKEDEEVSEWKLGVVKSYSEADDFHFIEFPCEINEGESISQNDLLLLSKEKFQDGKRLPTGFAFALVESARKYSETRLVRVRLYLAGEFSHYNTDNVQSCPRPFNMRSHICQTERQLYFMKAGLSSKAFVLIQTQALETGISMVGYSINPRDSLIPKDGDDGFFPTIENELKPEAITSSRKYRIKVLVCAPSNSALDEIVLRFLNGGIHDENDRAYCPKVVRIGLKAHHSIKAVSLDELVCR